MKDNCPHCKANLKAGKIPEEYRKSHGTATHYNRVVSHEIPEIYDGGLFYECPDCKGRWHRWPEGDRLRVAAEPYVKAGGKP